MAETSEIVAGASAAGAALAAFLATIGLRKPSGKQPQKGGDLEARIMALETRTGGLEDAVIVLVEQQRRADEDRHNADAVRNQIFAEIRQTREAIARIEGRLQ